MKDNISYTYNGKIIIKSAWFISIFAHYFKLNNRVKLLFVKQNDY
jgi:hypothetical protein